MRRRAEAFAAFEALELPSEKEEVWRYSPIDELDLEAYAPAPVPPAVDPLRDAFVADLLSDLGAHAALVVVHAGRVVSVTAPDLAPGVAVSGLGPADGVAASEAPRPGMLLEGGDALVRLNDSFAADAVVVDVGRSSRVPAPLVVVQWCDGDPTPATGAPATFPRTVVRVAAGAEVSVVEVVAGAPGSARALVVPVTELAVGDGAVLSYVSLQVLGDGATCLARTRASVGADASLRLFTVGLGAHYDRSRTDAAVTGRGGSSQLRSAYLGTGDQVHDIRTLQDHDAPRSTSDLLCKGAVSDTARSVYSGLIRVRHGAVRSEAMQTNHNLVLGEQAHADSVPNLDIAENDVRCSHASTIGPVDEDQRYYLESRGVPPEQAERLIVLGFFNDIVDRSPVPAAVPRLRREVNLRLAATLGIGRGAAAPEGSTDGQEVSSDD